jgi:pimeloyl-ACP methyl ester carboxylesterase
MGMNAGAWADPAAARILGGAYRLSALLRSADDDLSTSFQDLRSLGYSVLAWTQSRPAGPIGAAVAELHPLLAEYLPEFRRGVIFICHSRGGLIARKYLADTGLPARALITLGTPHNGTTMARWSAFLLPVTSTLNTLFAFSGNRGADSAFRRVLRFLGSSSLKELLPGSVFYRNLPDRKPAGCAYISVGGTDPDLLAPLGLPLSEILGRFIPAGLVPEELRDGCGDGLVSQPSSVIPGADDHLVYHLSHVAMLFDKEVRAYVASRVTEVSG